MAWNKAQQNGGAFNNIADIILQLVIFTKNRTTSSSYSVNPKNHL